MCGITGFLHPGMTGDAEGLLVLAGRMAQTLRHRGPDGSGTYADPHGGLGLGHRRLAILDLSEAGRQPMRSRSGRFVLVHNGEIYNFPALRTTLEAEGGPFLPWRGQSDTEVMLAAFEAWGVETALARFVGMFAFALWDCRELTLHLARDRMGEKPLHYGRAGAALVFGSELKAFRAFPTFEPQLDMAALAHYLRFQYVPEPGAIYEGVRKLEPGHLLTIRADAPHDTKPRPYWSLAGTAQAGLTDPFVGDEAEAADELERLLGEAVSGQMLSDVPLGALLSGGVDSSLVTAMMQARADRPVRSFTIGFDEAGYDESAHASAVAERLGTEHTELTVRPDQALDLVERLPDMFDEPFADASQLPTALVAQLTRRHVTVCLTGDGGDEIFAGYNRHFWADAVWRRIGGLPSRLRGLAADGITRLSPKTYDALFEAAGELLPRAARVRTPGHKAHKLASILSAASREELYERLVSTWQDPDAVLGGAHEPASPIRGAGVDAMQGDFIRWMQRADSVGYLPGDILHKVDRATMAASLESRAPYLDHRVIEFAWRLPTDMLVQGRQGKRILRRLLDRHVPRELVERPKMGFGVPLDDWLRGPLRAWVLDVLSPEKIRRQGLFDAAKVDRQLSDHFSKKRDNQYRIWNLCQFQAWHDRWMA